jgi:4-amino-4-deoxy-L-arabinose transferase-like glycosyltransferase
MSGTRRPAALVLAVLSLAAFNLTYRLGRESLTEWDGSLYAHSALEMIESGGWVGTTFYGELDYYNSKPPLNVWLIALSLELFGPSLVAVRAGSVLSAWLTVAVLLAWAWRRFSPRVGLLSALVLATCFGFLHVHSGRTANADAPLTLLLLLVVVTLDLARERPWRRAWLGPILAAVFLLKGMAVLMPLLLVVVVEARRRLGWRERWAPLAAALASFAAPVGAWAVARFQIDRWAFFERLVMQDFVALSTTTLDGHAGSPLFYLNILQKHHYDWMVAALAAVILFPPASWASVRRALAFWRGGDDLRVLLGSWTSIALLVPTLMQTKLPWYLNPLYPIFALGVGWVLSQGFSRGGFPRHHRLLLVAMIVMAAGVAESKLIWYSFAHRGLEQSVQGLLLHEADRVRGSRVYRARWDRAETFVLKALVQARGVEVMTVEEFLRDGAEGDYLIMEPGVAHPDLMLVRVHGEHGLYRRR